MKLYLALGIYLYRNEAKLALMRLQSGNTAILYLRIRKGSIVILIPTKSECLFFLSDCTSMSIGLSYPSVIPDHRFTASSYYNDCYIPSNGTTWIQIDLSSVVYACAVATQVEYFIMGKKII
jgi:hypothetical protein